MRFSLKNNMTISVIIPTLNNRPKFIKEALNSIQKQTYSPSEIIIVNNGTGEVDLSEINLNIRQLKMIFRAGVAQARNFGASMANSDYIAFLDDDDMWDHRYLEHMINKINNEKPDCLIAKLDQLLDGKIVDYKNAQGQIRKDVLMIRNPGINGSSVVFKKKIFFDVGGYNPKLTPSEDKTLIFELIKNGSFIVSVPESKAVLRKKRNEKDRFTDDGNNVAEGLYQFYRMYKNQMNLSEKIYNLYKINGYYWKAQKSIIFGFKYIFLLACYKIMKITK